MEPAGGRGGRAHGGSARDQRWFGRVSPVRGSGVVVGGHGDWDGHGDGGTLRISSLRTGVVHTDGGVPTGTRPQRRRVRDPGCRGRRGRERGAGDDARVTHGDGSTGVWVSKPLPTLEISGDISTEGGEGMSLVRGVQMALKAVALSVKPGGSVGSAGRCAPPVRTSSRSRWTGRSTTSMSPVGSPLRDGVPTQFTFGPRRCAGSTASRSARRPASGSSGRAERARS